MRSSRVLLLVALATAAVPATAIRSQDSRAAVMAPLFTNEQLDNLVAPIALYPDAILAQILIAATFPEQIDLAARWVRAHGTRDIDDQNWDVSVKAVAHYPPVLNMLADRDDWTTALGQAYAEQSTDVMESVQHLREMARAQGNLESTPQQRVIVDDRAIRIVPVEPRVIYVPTYDPEIIYYRPVVYVGVRSSYWSFGIGFPIGAWLSYDCDWYGRRVYYDGWRGDGWRVASYPYIVVNTVYVHPRYETVYVNRNVWYRTVNYTTFNRYNTVHRTVNWNDRRSGGSPGPLPRGVANNNNGRRDDGRGDVGRGDAGRNDGRNDGRNAQGRNDTQGRNGAQGQTRDQNAGQNRDQNAGQNRDPNRDDNRGQTRGSSTDNGRTSRVEVPSRPVYRAPDPVTVRPPVVRERPDVQPQRDVRRGGVVAPRVEQPRVEQPRVSQPRASQPRAPQSRVESSRGPAVERRSAPSADRRSAPPSRSASARGEERGRKK